MGSIKYNVPLGSLTSLGCGGPASSLLSITSAEEVEQLLTANLSEPYWSLGYGTNVLISDHGLEGTVILFRGGKVSSSEDQTIVIADAGVWWDDVVGFSVKQGLWGMELMSGIPGNVGAAVAGNIAAYGQAVSDSLVWADIYDFELGAVERLKAKNLGLSYRNSYLHTPESAAKVVIRAAFQLSRQAGTELKYQSAIDAADELKLNTDTLTDRRRIILHARDKAGSLYDPSQNSSAQHRSAGSFFKNPLVTDEQAREVMKYDETGRTHKQLSMQNQLHGGDKMRVSAAHVMLAAGFYRGQEWDRVRLHPSHVLKLENTGGARSQDIYEIGRHIVGTVKDKLGIALEPEVKFLGRFDD